MIENLNERITIQQSKHMTDKVGNHRNAWVDYYTCFAYASTYEAQEEDGEVTAEQKSGSVHRALVQRGPAADFDRLSGHVQG